ncbi:MAG TPA: hypothetical protein VE592_03745 [Geminicoccaceae bacterium]|jgi:hypothetical protein|nr:hypothetical protein [Geminicoccaceae bacterium]
MLKRPAPPRLAPSDADAPRVADRLFWLCVPIGIMAAIAILRLLGVSWWSAVAIAFLIACPVIVAWAVVVERGLPRPWGRKR